MGTPGMSDKKPFIVGNWDDLFLANKIRTVERKKKVNLYLATIGCLCFALFGAAITRGTPGGAVDQIQVAQRALWLAIVIGGLLVVTTVAVSVLSRKSPKVAMLESSLIKGFGTALDSSDLNPSKKDNKKGEVRT